MSTIAATNLKNASAGSNNIVLNTDGTIGGTCLTQTCRAWVNFNGTGTVAIRASYNVSSITDNGGGDYTVNFTTAMPDANYSAVASAGTDGTDSDDQYWVFQRDVANRTSSAIRLVTTRHGINSAWIPIPDDVTQFNVAIFR
jgi:hypothetical protein